MHRIVLIAVVDALAPVAGANSGVDPAHVWLHVHDDTGVGRVFTAKAALAATVAVGTVVALEDVAVIAGAVRAARRVVGSCRTCLMISAALAYA